MAGDHEPLVTVAPEFFVRDIAASIRFYTDVLGLTVLRQEPDFAVVALNDDAHVLLADERMIGGVTSPRGAGVHVRIVVDDVDEMYRRAKDGGARIVRDIGDRDYGLRDFIITDPDGFLVRFAAPLHPTKRSS